MRHLKTIPGMLVVWAVCACQSPIREDRSGCPATLYFEFLDSQGIGPAELMYLEPVREAAVPQVALPAVTHGLLYQRGPIDELGVVEHELVQEFIEPFHVVTAGSRPYRPR